MDKLEKILSLVEEYAEENLLPKEWTKGDWINYSGPNFDKIEKKNEEEEKKKEGRRRNIRYWKRS